MFKGFSHRLEHDVHRACNNRLAREVEVGKSSIEYSPALPFTIWLALSDQSTPFFHT